MLSHSHTAMMKLYLNFTSKQLYIFMLKWTSISDSYGTALSLVIKGDFFTLNILYYSILQNGSVVVCLFLHWSLWLFRFVIFCRIGSLLFCCSVVLSSIFIQSLIICIFSELQEWWEFSHIFVSLVCFTWIYICIF